MTARHLTRPRGTSMEGRRAVDAYDLVIIGGGIVGLGTARLAARHGLSVALIERADLAGGASSTTSHMLHGGLRYLEHGHFGLVRESLRERAAVMRMAPGLVQPTRFLVPSYAGDRRPLWMVRAGLALYDALAGRGGLSPHAAVRADEALALEPELSPEGLRGAGLYSDVVMDDARMAIAVALDAAAHGARIHTWAEVTGARPDGTDTFEVLARERAGGHELRVRGRRIINAAGAWADDVRTRLIRALVPGSPDPPPLLRPTRGVHLVFPALTRGHAIASFSAADGRVIFVIPFAGHSLVGTTEIEVTAGHVDEAWRPGGDEVRYLRAAVRRLLPKPAGQPPLAVFAGVRPLLASPGGVNAAPREHRVVEDGPLLTVVGGKYTSFRVMARDVLDRALASLGRPAMRLDDDVAPLPSLPAPGTPVAALAAWAAESAFARTIDDVVRRRSSLWLAPDRGRVAAPIVASVLAQRLGWDDVRTRTALQEFHMRLEDEERVLLGTREDP